MTRLGRACAAAAALGCALPAFGQQPPDSGSVLRDLEKAVPSLPRQPAPRLDLREPARPALAPAPSARFVLKSWRISGNSVFGEAELAALVREYVGREIGFAELEEGAARITRHYRERGYLVARAYLPQQDIRDGAVEIAVLEGRFANIELQNRSRVRDATVLRYFDGLQGGPVEERALERKLLLLSDLPGAGAAEATVKPGAAVGETDLALGLGARRLLGGVLEFDNHGNHFTGEYRAAAQLDLTSPLGYGDVLSARLTRGIPNLQAWRLAYQTPLGSDGLRLGGVYSDVRYRIGKEFASLEAHGTAKALGGNVSYPFLRSRSHNLYAQLAVTRRQFDDRIDLIGSRTDRSTNVAAAVLSGDWRDAFGGGGVNAFYVGASAGSVEIGTAAARTLDEATLRTNGGFQKLNWSVQRLQAVGGRFSVHGALSGQHAGKNLDSSEKFSLGGPTGVRAYPVGEASGDQGLLLNAELRYDVEPARLQVFGFYDAGEVRFNRAPLAGTTGNERHLGALGLGVTWLPTNDLIVRFVAAQPLGSGDATAGPHRRPRAWLQLAQRF